MGAGRPRKPTNELAGYKKETKELVAQYEVSAQKYLATVRSEIEEVDFAEIKANRAMWCELNYVYPPAYFAEKKAHKQGITAGDVLNALNLTIELSKIFNTYVKYQPTIYTYFRVLGISSQTFAVWIGMNDDRGNACKEVQDYFRSTLAQTLIAGDIHPASGTFIGKAMLGLKEDNAPVTNINILGDGATVQTILDDYGKNY